MLGLLLFILGLFFGSFLLVLIDRLPREETVLKGRSHCDYCKHVLNWYDLLPFFSFLSTGGKCRYCHKKLSFYYPFLELFTGVLFAIMGVYFLFLYPTTYTLNSFLWLLYTLFITSSFIVIFFTDLKYGIIPDKIVFLGIVVTFLFLFLSPAQLLNHIFAAFIAFGIFLLLHLVTKGKGMGLGDVKLVFWLGLILGIIPVLLALYISFILGALVSICLILTHRKKLKGSTVPFGPFLIIGATIVFFYGNIIINYISRFFLIIIHMRLISFIPFKFITFLIFLFIMGYIVQYYFDPLSYFIKPADVRRVNDLSTLQQALEDYYKYQGSYPRSSDSYTIIGFNGKPIVWGGKWIPYLSQLPADPDTNKTYVYIADNITRQSYALYTSLDNPKKYPQTCLSYRCDRAPNGACGVNYSISCNYGVSSANISP